MRWASHNPLFDKRPNVRFKMASCIGIACGRTRPFSGIPFSDYEFQLTIPVLSNAEHCDGSFLQFEFHRCSGTGLSVIFFEAS